MLQEIRRTALRFAVAAGVAATATTNAIAEPLDLPRLPRESNDQVSPNGVMAEWDNEFGVDPNRPVDAMALAPGALPPHDGTGTAWASISAPASTLGWKKASIKARLNPAEQAEVGVTLERPIASLGEAALTLENSYSLTRQIAAASPIPQPPEQASHTWEAVNAVRLDIQDTSVSIGTSLSSDDTWRGKVGLSHEILEGLSISTEVTTGSDDADASINAEYKLKW
jgi:hypothetical protein